MDKQELGRYGEDVAARFLEGKGYVVLDRRYRFERAEIDLVCFQPRRDGRPGGELVFVEVKTRSGPKYGHPEDAVSQRKRRSMVHAARAYLYERKMEGALARFDVVAIVAPRGDVEPSVTHYPAAFAG